MSLPAVRTMELMSPLNQLAMPVEVRQEGNELVETNQIQLALFNKMAQIVTSLKLENTELKKQLKIASNNHKTVSADLAAMQLQSQLFVD